AEELYIARLNAVLFYGSTGQSGSQLCLGTKRGFQLRMSRPTIEADIRLAMVPAIIARKPSLASWSRLLGASAPIPPIWMPMELKLAKPQRAKVAMVKERGSSEAFCAPRSVYA